MLALVLFSIPGLLLAHAGGASLEKVVSPYVVDVGYDPARVIAGDRIVFDFNLLSEVSSSTVDFDYVRVRLEHEGMTLFSTGVSKPEYGPTSLLYTVPVDASGALTVFVRYHKGSESLAEAEFMIPIEARRLAWRERVDISSLIGGVILGLFASVGIFILKRKAVV